MISSFKGEYEFLSNFYTSPILYKGIIYPSVEHAYQASKTLDIEERRRIATLATAGEAKKAGKKLKIREDWEDVKQAVMLTLLMIKFENINLRQKLMDTGSEDLVEGNWWGDRYWGQCPVGTGHNVLGRLLMSLRTSYLPKPCRACGGYNSDSSSIYCVPCQGDI